MVPLRQDPDGFEHAQHLRWNTAITWILKATVFARGASRRPLVKSPANSFRIPRLNTLFPDAIFIRVVREPCAVFASSLRLWQSMWDRYAVTAPLKQEDLIERVLETRLALERRLHSGLRTLPPQRAATIRYEDLVVRRVGVIEGG